MSLNLTTWSQWHGCYEGGWKGIIIPEAFVHPAKFSRALVERIVRHGLQCGYWRAGDLIGDPFGGVGLGGIACAYHGLRWLGVELEPPFVDLAQRNFERHRAAWAAAGDPHPKIIQGDSREFARLVGEVAGVVTSPPYADISNVGEYRDPDKCLERERRYLANHPELVGKRPQLLPYGSSPGQIGALPAGKLDATITSPPYAESIKGDHGERETAQESRDKRQTEGGSLGQSQRFGGYGASEGNIGNLKEGAIDGVVTSPPYEAANSGDANSKKQVEAGYFSKSTNGKLTGTLGVAAYGDSEGQIGVEKAENYWQAMKVVYEQMRLAMKPGAVAAIVLKDYIKAGKRVLLCDDTCRLLESLGFTVFERTRAHLVKRESHPGLFDGEPVVKKTERKSFFRRLHEKKLAEDDERRIDWEEVIWCRKPDLTTCEGPNDATS